jgi:uncharacterized protein (TIGR03032 family)
VVRVPPNSPTKLSMQASPGLGEWMRERSISLLVSAYQSGRLISIGTGNDGKLRLDAIKFDRSMGLAADRSGIWVATLNSVWRFGYLREERRREESHDVVLAPQAALFTGYVNAHDLAIGPQGRPMFAASMFNCVATTTLEASLVPIWYPRFLTNRSPKDVCHLNGLALDQERLRFVTVFAQRQDDGAWRDGRAEGAVIDVASNTPYVTGLAQPHSPRLHDGRLWLHESGKGAFGYIDGDKFVEVLRCPGYLRGLAFDRDIACIGMSKPRDTESPGAKAFASILAERGTEASCGILFFDLKQGSVIHSLRFGQGVDEIYDIAVLGYRDPMLISPDSPEASRTYILGKLPPQGPAKTNKV